MHAKGRARQSQITTARAMSVYNSTPAIGAVLRLLLSLAGMCTRGGGALVRKERDREKGELELRGRKEGRREGRGGRWECMANDQKVCSSGKMGAWPIPQPSKWRGLRIAMHYLASSIS